MSEEEFTALVKEVAALVSAGEVEAARAQIARLAADEYARGAALLNDTRFEAQADEHGEIMCAWRKHPFMPGRDPRLPQGDRRGGEMSEQDQQTEADGPSLDAQESVAAELALSSVVGLLDTAHMACRDVLSGSVEGSDIALRLAHGHLLIAIQMLTELIGEDESEDEIHAQDEEDAGDRTEG